MQITPSEVLLLLFFAAGRLESFLPASIELLNPLLFLFLPVRLALFFFRSRSAFLKRHLFLWLNLALTHDSFGSSRATSRREPSY